MSSGHSTGFLGDRSRERAAVAAFVAAVHRGDVTALHRAIAAVESEWAWQAAFRACSKLKGAPQPVRHAFLDLWVEAGETLRSNVDDDLVLVAALHVLLPPYDGAPVPLFRGESFGNRQRRTYGMSWSANRDIARQFACNRADCYEGGTVLLGTIAPTQAVISALAAHRPAAEHGLEEYIIDRRRLAKVQVLERFRQPPSAT